MRSILISIVFLVVIFVSAACAEDPVGTWDLKMYGPHGEENMILVIQTGGESLSITGNHPALGDIDGTGSLEGNAITIRTNPAGPKEISLEFTGMIRGDSMSGTRELKMYGDGSIQVKHDDEGNTTAVGRNPDLPSTFDPATETWSNEWTAQRR
jgi:hypothetical protein